MPGPVRNEGYYTSAGGVILPINKLASTFANTNTSASSWTSNVTFTTACNMALCLATWEQGVTLDTVVVNPAGLNVALSAVGTIASGATGNSNTHCFGLFNSGASLGLNATLDVVYTFSGIAAGSRGMWQFERATRLPTTGDHSNAVGGSGTSRTGSLTPGDAIEEAGIIIAGMNVNLGGGAAITCGGGLTEPELHYNDGADGINICVFSENLGPLIGAQSPSFAWTGSFRAGAKFVLAA